MKKGFTMIELIFVIVILGILAAVAIPKLAATRDDAKAASIKTDIGTAIQAVPAWFQGQKQASFLNAMSLDTKVWSTGSGCEYVFTDDVGGTVTMGIHNDGNNTAINKCDVDANTTIQPFLEIKLSASGTGIVKQLKSSMGVTDQNITLGGKKVQW